MDTRSPVQPGDELAGKYRIERVMAQGGMGVVVAARHLRLDEQVAIKFLLPGSLESPEAVARFEREARAAARIRSEHSVRVRDVGTLDWGAPYLVMEYLEGYDLNVELSRRGTLPVQESLDYVLQACEAIAEAHSLGVVHRDLKPANLFLSRRVDGSVCVKVLDFGISKLSNVSASQATPDYGMTHAASLLGSPYYMSPEQITAAREVDHRADVWALGVILYEMLSGTHPFEGESLQSLAVAVVTQPPEPLPIDGTAIPAALVEIIMLCLEKSRTQRVQSVAELASRLKPFAPASAQLSIERILRVGEGTSIASYPPADPATATSGCPPHRTHWGFSMTRSWAATRSHWVVLVAAVVVAVAVVSATWLRGRAGRKPLINSAAVLSGSTISYVKAASEPEPKVQPEVLSSEPVIQLASPAPPRPEPVPTHPGNAAANKSQRRPAVGIPNAKATVPSAAPLSTQHNGTSLGGRL